MGWSLGAHTKIRYALFVLGLSVGLRLQAELIAGEKTLPVAAVAESSGPFEVLGMAHLNGEIVTHKVPLDGLQED